MQFEVINCKGVNVWDPEKDNQGYRVFIYEGEFKKKKFRKMGIIEIYKLAVGTVKEKMIRVHPQEKASINKFGKKTRRLTIQPHMIPSVVNAMKEVYKMLSGEEMKGAGWADDSELYEIGKEIYGGKPNIR